MLQTRGAGKVKYFSVTWSPVKMYQRRYRPRVNAAAFWREKSRQVFFLAAAAQNIKRLVRFLSQGQRPISHEDVVVIPL